MSCRLPKRHYRRIAVLLPALLIALSFPVTLHADDPSDNGGSEEDVAYGTRAARSLARGDLESAYEFFTEAAVHAESPEHAQEYALRAAGLLIEFGDYRAALERAVALEAGAVTQSVRQEASVLGIRALYYLGNAEDALRRISRLEPTNPSGLFLWSLLAAEQDPAEGESALTRLLDAFPGSIEGSLAAAEEGTSLPTLPSRLLRPRAFQYAQLDDYGSAIAETAETAETAESTPVEPASSEMKGSNGERLATAIQVGSFSARQNALRYAEAIAGTGWSTEVQEVPDGTHRVVIPFEDARSRDEAEAILLQLRAEGIEGFLRFADAQ